LIKVKLPRVRCPASIKMTMMLLI